MRVWQPALSEPSPAPAPACPAQGAWPCPLQHPPRLREGLRPGFSGALVGRAHSGLVRVLGWGCCYEACGGVNYPCLLRGPQLQGAGDPGLRPLCSLAGLRAVPCPLRRFRVILSAQPVTGSLCPSAAAPHPPLISSGEQSISSLAGQGTAAWGGGAVLCILRGWLRLCLDTQESSLPSHPRAEQGPWAWPSPATEDCSSVMRDTER